ncbi:hypothetical protein BKY29_09270 [Weissella confusa]|uniref:hypothetical protein n=1 Tax=Weissella confusa TaxID=1583 RepID=UPI0008FDDC00|nr:hypothetical protein [Weissella confusa]OJF02920.1 hypothetical protein BKY29_09270 [Weissella confusa]
MEKSVAKKKRVGWLDYGKGILILNVVLVHTIGSLYKTGQFPAAAMGLEMSQRVLFMFVMPVFLLFRDTCSNLRLTGVNT